jgi:hypothetical protein
LVLGLHTGDVAASLGPGEEREVIAEFVGTAAREGMQGVLDGGVHTGDVSNSDAGVGILNEASPAYVVTSVVRAAAMNDVFPIAPAPWQLEGLDIASGVGAGVGTRLTLRDAFCSLNGLTPEVVETGRR